MKKSLILAIVVLVIILGVIYYLRSNPGSYPGQQNQTVPAPIAPVPAAGNISDQNTAPAASAPSASASVSISNFTFAPSALTVHKGTTVTWTNNDDISHTVTGDNGGPSSRYLQRGEVYGFTFTTTGSFSYHCSVHPGMKATVQVID